MSIRQAITTILEAQMIPDDITIFAMEQNLLDKESRKLRLDCGCRARVFYIRSWDNERWVIVMGEYLRRCSGHKSSLSNIGVTEPPLYLTQELIELNKPRVVSPGAHRWSATMRKIPRDPR